MRQTTETLALWLLKDLRQDFREQSRIREKIERRRKRETVSSGEEIQDKLFRLQAMLLEYEAWCRRYMSIEGKIAGSLLFGEDEEDEFDG